MKEITTVIATTLPDQLGAKFTKNVLKKFRDQANTPGVKLQVIGKNKEIVGYVKNTVFTNGSLRATMEIDVEKIDTQWEYFFVPSTVPTKVEKQGNFLVMLNGIIKGVSMAKFPHDLSLKPVRFEKKYTEETDYLIREYTDISPEELADCFLYSKPTIIYYPETLGTEMIIKDAENKGIIAEDGTGKVNQVFPYQMFVWPSDFKHFKNWVKEQWKQTKNTSTMESQLKKLIANQSLN